MPEQSDNQQKIEQLNAQNKELQQQYIALMAEIAVEISKDTSLSDEERGQKRSTVYRFSAWAREGNGLFYPVSDKLSSSENVAKLNSLAQSYANNVSAIQALQNKNAGKPSEEKPSPAPSKSGNRNDDNPDEDEPVGPDGDEEDDDFGPGLDDDAWPSDEDGNIKGLNIPEYNRIQPGDSKAVKQTKRAAQRRQAAKEANQQTENTKTKHEAEAGKTEANKKGKTYQPGGYTKKNDGSKVLKTKGLKAASEYAKTYTSFSGHDMVVTVEVPVDQIHHKSVVKTIGEFQTISYSVHDEKTPVRNIGNMNPRDWVFGPRMVAGTLVLTVFNRHWMHALLDEYNEQNKIYTHYLMDELPPLNITISAANEYGKNARLCIYGVTFVNEGQVMSINDIYTENTYQFMAFDVDYLTPAQSSIHNGTRLNYAGGGIQRIPVRQKNNTAPSSTPQITKSKNTKGKQYPSRSAEREKAKAKEPKMKNYETKYGKTRRAYASWYYDYLAWINDMEKVQKKNPSYRAITFQRMREKAKMTYENRCSIADNKKKEERDRKKKKRKEGGDKS